MLLHFRVFAVVAGPLLALLRAQIRAQAQAQALAQARVIKARVSRGSMALAVKMTPTAAWMGASGVHRLDFAQRHRGHKQRPFHVAIIAAM